MAAEAAARGRADASFLGTRYARRWDRDRGRLLRRGDRFYLRAAALNDRQWEAILERAARLSPEELATLVRGDLSLGFLARVYWHTRRERRRPEGSPPPGRRPGRRPSRRRRGRPLLPGRRPTRPRPPVPAAARTDAAAASAAARAASRAASCRR